MNTKYPRPADFTRTLGRAIEQEAEAEKKTEAYLEEWRKRWAKGFSGETIPFDEPAANFIAGVMAEIPEVYD